MVDKEPCICKEHSGIVAELNAGSEVMDGLRASVDELRKSFVNHVSSSAKSTIAILLGILLCFMTGLIGIFVNSISQAEAQKAEIVVMADKTAMTQAIIGALEVMKKDDLDIKND